MILFLLSNQMWFRNYDAHIFVKNYEFFQKYISHNEQHEYMH